MLATSLRHIALAAWLVAIPTCGTAPVPHPVAPPAATPLPPPVPTEGIDPGKPWRFVVYGDTRGTDAEPLDDSDHRKVLAAIAKNTPDYRFIINVGDLVNRGTVREQWEAWQRSVSAALGETQNFLPPKLMAVPGNHDRYSSPAGHENWRNALSGQVRQFPNGGEFFFFDYREVRILMLNSERRDASGKQAEMFATALATNAKPWLFAVWHRPIFPFGDKRYENGLDHRWSKPLFENGCDIIFTGHAHYYVRTKKLAFNGQDKPPVDPERGTVMIVTGNGGAPLREMKADADGNGYMVEAGDGGFFGYTEITVDGDTLTLRHVKDDGSTFDTATYKPNPKPRLQPVAKE
jgi:predicted phosphodiesterase